MRIVYLNYSKHNRQIIEEKSTTHVYRGHYINIFHLFIYRIKYLSKQEFVTNPLKVHLLPRHTDFRISNITHMIKINILSKAACNV